jgi:HSP20 family molecular chaperone IbpA
MSNQDKYTVVEYRKNKKNNNYEEEFKNLQKRLHSPKVDLFERDSSYFVTIELPGVDSNSLKITFKDDQILFVSGSKLKDYILNTDKIIYRETKYNDFNRRIKLPGLVEKENYTLDLNQGVLILNIKKKLTEYSDIMHFNEIDIKGKSWADL